MRILSLLALFALAACSKSEPAAETTPPAAKPASAPAVEAPAKQNTDHAGHAGHAGHADHAGHKDHAGHGHEGDHGHAAHDKDAKCVCAEGKAGGTVWCEKCDKGFIKGKTSKCKSCWQGKTSDKAVWCDSCKSGYVSGKPIDCKTCFDHLNDKGAACAAHPNGPVEPAAKDHGDHKH
ncbi:MAG: hypothetical protein OSB21_13650 [Myxococcota bacterium]|nr:hypothetical protein [Myxococcota bacterium]